MDTGRLDVLSHAAILFALVVAQDQPDARDDRHALRIFLPLYQFPDPDPKSDGYKVWQRVINTPKGVPVVAVLNPASGPVEPKDPEGEPIRQKCYRELMDRAKANPDLSFLGYVTLCQGKIERRGGQPEWIVRDARAIERDIDLWYEIYGKGRASFVGIFLDEHPAFDEEQLRKSTAAVQYILKKDPKALVIRNLGRVPDTPTVMSPPGGQEDVACLWEHDAKVTPFDRFARPEWSRKSGPDGRPLYSAKRFAALVYNQSEPRHVRQAVEKGVGWLCVSDKSGSWPGLPSYWEKFADEVAAVNAEARKKPR
jgi:hypothetical protein